LTKAKPVEATRVAAVRDRPEPGYGSPISRIMMLELALAELHNLLHNSRDCRCAAAVAVQKARFFNPFDDADGPKNRCTSESKNWIDQVLISVILSVRGEVAERLKAAVC
jgi:hypothetical protein